jgi:hypothetical protein
LIVFSQETVDVVHELVDHEVAEELSFVDGFLLHQDRIVAVIVNIIIST